MENIKTAKKRSEISNEYKWALNDIYSSNEEFEKDFEYLKAHISDVDKYKGKLLSNSKTLEEALRLIDELSLKAERLFVYAKMKKDEDNAESLYQGMTDRAMNLNVQFSAKLSFFDPEILSGKDEVILSFIEENKGLEPFDFYLKSLIRSKQHILDEKTEEILALSSEMARGHQTTFTMLNNADLKFGVVSDHNGDKVELTHGRYGDLMRGTNRKVRETVFKQYYAEFIGHKNTIASTLGNSVKSAWFYANQRKFESTLHGSLFSDNVSMDVYNNLISTIHEGLPTMERYFELKKKALKIDEMHMYDIYAPVVEHKEHIKFEDAKDILLEGLAPLGEEYKELLNRSFDEHWMDVYENCGKTSGAYCWGAYGTHPFVLLNYQGNVDGVFTMAHELGHAMHSHYSDTNQPYSKAQYTIFVAEVASIVNEVLLNYHLLGTTTDKEKKLSIVHHFLEQFRTTLFRQTMFAEFEQIIHNASMEGTPLTTEYLTNTYYDLNKKYHGNIVCDEEIGNEWSRIPHFYNEFYVYKYATGFSAAVSIANSILKGNNLEGYLKTLKSGGSDFPIELLKYAGVDMNSPQPIKDCLGVFSEMVDLFEELTK